MTEIRSLEVGELGTNCYIVITGDKAAVIDPGSDYEKICEYLRGAKCTDVLLTHAHYDHIGAVAEFQRGGAKVYLHSDDLKILSGNGNLAELFGYTLDKFTPDAILTGGETVQAGGTEFKVLHTPGHTDGSVCYVHDDVIFTGDTIFYLSVGRTDFPTGSSRKLHDSIVNGLFSLENDHKLLPGHGCATTLSFERKNNPYV